MSDKPITVAPAIQRLALALAALDGGYGVRLREDGTWAVTLANADEAWNFAAPLEALEFAGLNQQPHPAIMSLVSALQQARERLAEQHECMVVIKWETDDDGGLRPEEWYESDNNDVLAAIDAALKGG